MYCRYDEAEVRRRFAQFEAIDAPSYDGGVMDFFGVKIPAKLVHYIGYRCGEVIKSAPFPDDGIRAGYMEYLAIVDSIAHASGEKFQMAEIGASYGPFGALAAVLALRANPHRPVSLRYVEAARNGPEVIGFNLHENGLDQNPLVDTQIFSAAITSQPCKLFFPDVDCTVDNGASTTVENVDADIRGLALPNFEVEGIPMDQVLASFDPNHLVDLIHIDIQGAELEVVPDSIGLLNKSVKRMMIATHSRFIEGTIMEIMHRNGWYLVAEDPVCLSYNPDRKSMVGMTTLDGTLYLENKRFA